MELFFEAVKERVKAKLPVFLGTALDECTGADMEGDTLTVYASKIAQGRLNCDRVKTAFAEETGARYVYFSDQPPIPLSVNTFAAAVHQNAVDHGWWDKEPAFGEIIALCHAELSEALEYYRDGMPLAYVEDSSGDPMGSWVPESDPGKWGAEKPEGQAVELADCMIRIMDWFGAHPELNLEKILLAKHRYNLNRPYRHGGKRI